MFRAFFIITFALNFQLGGFFLLQTDSSASVKSQGYFGYLYDDYSDEAEPSKVTFVTKLRHKRDLTKQDYHIIEVRIISRNIKFTIHLSRNDDLQNVQVSSQLMAKEGSEIMNIDLENCFYTGIIPEYPGGRAALSACGDNLGFSGHILLDDEHWVLEQVLDASESLNSSTNYENQRPSIHHRVYRAANVMKQHNGSHSDMLRVPKEELEKAVAEMANSTKGEEEDSGDDDDSKESSTKKSASVAGTLLDTDEDSNQGFQLETFAPRNKPRKKVSKMSVAGTKVVEIAIFTDPKLFVTWQKRYAKDTKAKLKNFILSMVNNMNLLYQQPSLGVEIVFRLVYMEILQKLPSGLDSSGGEATKYLKSFCKYAGDKNENGGNWDHALLLTGHDIKDADDETVAGMAWFSTMCLRYWSCSITEGTSFVSTFIITHEIGHSLGMEHDGTGSSAACDENKHIMSPTTGSGKTTWSSCSTQNLKDFITKGTSDLNKKDLSNIPICITRASPLKSQKIRFTKQGGKLPGESYTSKIQCQYDCGSQCSAYANTADPCSMLWCSKPGKSLGITDISQAHPALEGTTCATGKYCRNGKCVKIPKSR